MKYLLTFIFLSMLCITISYAQIDTAFTDVEKTIQVSKASNIREISPMSSLETWLSSGVLVFGLLMIIAEVILILKKHIEGEQAFKIILITLIIISSIFLITAGYGNNQIAPAMGLLGTIAGYLLGKNDNSKK